MHAVVIAEDIQNLAMILSNMELESCDLYIAEWVSREVILKCLNIIQNNFDGEIYLITKNIPIPDWAFELNATVSVLWDDKQNPSNLALCKGFLEIDLISVAHLDVLDQIKNVMHFLSTEDLKVNKKCIKKNQRDVILIRNAGLINTNDLHAYLQ